MTHPSSPTRRSLIKAGAWTAPAIVLATAAPAFATSGSRALSLEPGDTAVVDDFGLASLRFEGFSISVGAAVPAGGLRLAVGRQGSSLMELGTPEGWTMQTSTSERIVYTRSVSTQAGEIVTLADGTYASAEVRDGAYTVTVTAPDHDAVRASFRMTS